MKFFDSIIDEALTLISGFSHISYGFNADKAWKDIGCNQVVLQRDSAYELSGTGFNLVTSSQISDGIIVVGKELADIKENCSFARISLIQIDETKDEQTAHNLIRKIEYVKYHCFPDGYMMRSASSSNKEAVRIAKYALRDGIDFESVGNLFIKKYKENPSVRGVKLIFVTDPKADYSSVCALAEKSNAITKTLNHVMNSVNFDCDTCNLKAVCDEVEGMRELHFGKAAHK